MIADAPAIADAKLLMIILSSEHAEELEVLLQRNSVDGYTMIPGAHGMGRSGPRMGSSAYPKTSTVFFTVLPGSEIDPLVADIEKHCAECMTTMRMMVWAVDRVVA